MKAYPLQFKPVLKQTIWGGRLLGERLGKPIGDESDYAESWEVVDHGADQSVVTSGELAGKTLKDLLTDHCDWLMGEAAQSSFPLLLKYLDCNRVLSVQVHPSDEYGARMPVPDLGKTEAWYIVDAKPGSVIYAGLKSGVDAPALKEAIEQGRAEDVLHQFEPQPGDCVFIPAGTVHAIGAGLLVAEIQQSSDTTFRLYDWNRVDANGNGRELHIQQSLDVTDFERGPVEPVRIDRSSNGWQTLVECDKFKLRAISNGSESVGGDNRFHIITVPQGQATLITDSQRYDLTAGDSVLLPAAHDAVTLNLSDDTVVLTMT
ncbi:type I phosphomannose isomerase catalytic subunit [Aporhodopirellula aestuarii]|uniref:Phosphohexomutase n=1 Tax=Aporhodopirellula aestuarii TaxID=2950107 RepID=A0ABT0TXJ2_9BACT|nr:type I phosphomannose isomerase catalytic subunit [Aporhodopirellula aestuarii]MCM2369191.1 class I mannose-6-phosphate isomerase [Aporhodopirellula aestuarii]